MTTLDRMNANTGILTLSDGAVYECYGDNWNEIVTDAKALAETLSVTIDIFNSEIPE